MNLYAGSDDRFYTDLEVSWHFESDEWQPCMWDSEDGWELVEEGSELVWLWPIGRDELPERVELQQEEHGYVVVDRRGQDDRDREEPEPMVGGRIP
jgi:hypothetical protein